MNNTLSNCHPLISFVYFTAVISFCMLFMHPVFVLIALFSAAMYSVRLNGFKALKFMIFGLLPLLLFSALINPFMNHKGATPLWTLNGNPITLEATIYGIIASIMFATVILWFSCFNNIITSDKLIFLFSKFIPSSGLIFSMTLRFVPRYKKQAKVIADAQKGIGVEIHSGNIFVRARNGLKILSILTTWAMENAIETADSMKSRGYGLKGRTSFHLFRMTTRDKILAFVLLVLIGILLIGAVKGENNITYFPLIIMNKVRSFSILIYIAYALLCLFPLIWDTLEDIRWHYIQSKT